MTDIGLTSDELENIQNKLIELIKEKINFINLFNKTFNTKLGIREFIKKIVGGKINITEYNYWENKENEIKNMVNNNKYIRLFDKNVLQIETINEKGELNSYHGLPSKIELCDDIYLLKKYHSDGKLHNVIPLPSTITINLNDNTQINEYYLYGGKTTESLMKIIKKFIDADSINNEKIINEKDKQIEELKIQLLEKDRQIKELESESKLAEENAKLRIENDKLLKRQKIIDDIKVTFNQLNSKLTTE